MNKLDYQYPRVELDLKKLKCNIDQIVSRCKDQGIGVAGVIKGFNGIPKGIMQYEASDCDYIATSRLEQLQTAANLGVTKPLMLIRIPMLSEAADVVRIADVSLNSEISVIKKLNEEAEKQNKIHKVILMVELGDLREGFWDKEELIKTAVYIEKELKGLKLLGIGTNLGCYGSIASTPEKMNELIEYAEKIEKEIGRKLDVISGGGTRAFPLVLKGIMPKRINNLRIGEVIVIAKELEELYGYDISFLNQDTFILKAEIIELKGKPTYPIGEKDYNAFREVDEYEDRGIRKRALAALGIVDFVFTDQLKPTDANISIIGASSDHLILDVEDCKENYKVGDILEFKLSYSTLVNVTNSPNVKIICK
ncbi:alanine/ornithine racemase family PLP-dependent enzyme [Anaerovorax odorimutans]|uniref:alanine/ornithine racemase family PLP-dependent enzyme n=1 Tax=Anaerovorax odorimutans TaxID=109327 RepID=UPI00041C7F05|nr:alanine/ornithine racemase family PLP-dependent enzyme [Anaerovorax odorimutans]